MFVCDIYGCLAYIVCGACWGLFICFVLALVLKFGLIGCDCGLFGLVIVLFYYMFFYFGLVIWMLVCVVLNCRFCLLGVLIWYWLIIYFDLIGMIVFVLIVFDLVLYLWLPIAYDWLVDLVADLVLFKYCYYLGCLFTFGFPVYACWFCCVLGLVCVGVEFRIRFDSVVLCLDGSCVLTGFDWLVYRVFNSVEICLDSLSGVFLFRLWFSCFDLAVTLSGLFWLFVAFFGACFVLLFVFFVFCIVAY